MQEYYFLFALALIVTIIAVIQDIKKREVANWLNFSFIAFALAYCAFYSIANKNFQFLTFGIAGFIIFFALAHLFYYSKAFAGGDAKLLMGYGIILPYSSLKSFAYLPLLFILLLFTVGAVYSLVYSIAIALKNKKIFKKTFSTLIKKYKLLLIILFIISLASLVTKITTIILAFSLLFLILLLYIYTKAIDTCMIILTPPNKLTEGDWLVHDIKLSKNVTIKKTVHGLSLSDISLIKKSKKKILIKTGIPFTPAFLISLIIMVYVLEVLKLQLFSFLAF